MDAAGVRRALVLSLAYQYGNPNKPYLRYGLKLHFGNSDVDMDDPRQVAQVRLIFRAADEHGMAIVVHMRPSVTRHRPYGTKEAKIFLDEVLPAAPHVPIQIAHLAGAGGFDDPSVDGALSVFIDAIAREDCRMANIYFDICGVAGIGQWKEKKALIAERIRQVGIRRILWGSDGFFGAGISPAQALQAYRKLPLTKEEFHTIDTNLAPHMR